MRTEVEGRVSAEAEGERCAFGLKLGKRLIEEIRPLVDRHGMRTETLDGAIEEATSKPGRIGRIKNVSGEELRPSFLGPVSWKIFVRCAERR